MRIRSGGGRPDLAQHQRNCEVCDRLRACREGSHPGLIMEMETGFAVLGDSQFFLGYSLLLCKAPVTELDELPRDLRLRHLEEMSQLAAAVRMVTRAHKINCEALGNLVHHLHWHVFPRRTSDPAPEKAVWVQMPQDGEEERHRLDARAHGSLIDALREALERIRRGET
jgi:diadenosine tetraphosphate (Ap4A) HIT family hydrolase